MNEYSLAKVQLIIIGIYRVIYNDMKYTILSFVSIILLVSCNKYNNFKSYNIIEMDSLNEELQEIICNYITNNSDNHSFVLVTDVDYIKGDWDIKNRVFLLGPSYQRLFEWGEDSFTGYPSAVMKTENAVVFIHNPIDAITKNEFSRNNYEKQDIPLPDSINSYVRFMSEAIAICVFRNSADIISNQVDTLLLKKVIPFDVPSIKVESQ